MNVIQQPGDPKRAPKLTQWLLRLALRGEAREVIAGDLEEEFSARVRAAQTARDRRGASWWFWKQAISSVLARMSRGPGEASAVHQHERNMEGAMGTFMQDVKYGMRMLRRTPGMSLLAVLTLALGIGANTTVFNWMKAVLFEPLPAVERQGDLVGVFRKTAAFPTSSVSYPDYLDARARSKSLEGLAALTMSSFSLAQEGRADLVYAEVVSENFFDVLHVRQQLGRGFSAEEGKPGAPHVAVISDGLWRSRYAADPEIVGKEILLNGNKFTVVGVTPKEFAGGEPAMRLDLWTPIVASEEIAGTVDRLQARGNHWLTTLGRRQPGVSTAQVNAELAKISDDMATELPNYDRGATMLAYPLWKLPRGAADVLGPVLLVLMALAAVVLLIACANVANVLLSRSLGRRREMAIRLSLGASRTRIARQLFIESGLLALGGGILAALVAYATSGLLVALVPPTGLPVSMATGIDWKLLGFTLAIAMLAAIIFGLAPALQASRAEPVSTLKEEASSVAGGGRGWLRNTLVVVQVALSLVMLVAAGLFTRSLSKAQAFEPGFNPKGVVIASVSLFPGRYTPDAGREFYRRAIERLQALPGVKSASLIRRIPLGFGGTSSTDFDVEGYTPASRDDEVWGYFNIVGPGFAGTLQLPLIAGRDFTTADRPGKPDVLIINRAMAEKYWIGRDPLGTRVRIGSRSPWMTVVGVVENSKMTGLKEKTLPTFYLAADQQYRGDMTFIVRTQGHPQSAEGAVRTTLQSLDGELAIFNLTTLEEWVRAATFQQELGGKLLGAFGGLALLLAAVGIFGVMAYSVSQRSHEIGVRMALGASRRSVFRLVIGHAMLLLGLGVFIGTIGASAAAQALKSLLFGISPMDPVTFVTVPLILAAVALAACLLPAVRATRVDPIIALRYE
jgi:predicted permease